MQNAETGRFGASDRADSVSSFVILHSAFPFAGVAQQRQQQFRKLPGTLPHGSENLPAGSSFEGKKSDGRIAERTRRDGATHVPLPSGSALDLFAPVAQSPERDASNVGDAGGSPAGSAISPR